MRPLHTRLCPELHVEDVPSFTEDLEAVQARKASTESLVPN